MTRQDPQHLLELLTIGTFPRHVACLVALEALVGHFLFKSLQQKEKTT